MNATNTEDRIRDGFADLLERLRAGLEEVPTNKIKSNTEARERERNRVWREYNEIGMLPPSEWALSITARRELGLMPIRNSEAAE